MRGEKPDLVSGFFMSGVGVSGFRFSIARDTDITDTNSYTREDLAGSLARRRKMNGLLTLCIQYDLMVFDVFEG